MRFSKIKKHIDIFLRIPILQQRGWGCSDSTPETVHWMDTIWNATRFSRTMSNTWKPRGWLADRQQTKELRASNQRVASFGWRRTKDTWGLPTATWILHGKVYMKVQFCFTTRAVVVNPSTMNKRNQKNNLATEHAETQSKLTWDPWRTPLPATRLHQRRLLDLLVPTEAADEHVHVTAYGPKHRCSKHKASLNGCHCHWGCCEGWQRLVHEV